MTSHADQIIDLYRRHAAAWAQARGTRLFERAWLDRFLSLTPAGGRVLDIGCGSGEPIARYLIEQGRQLTGVDSSPQMLSLCSKLFANNRWEQADMRTLSLSRAFDGLLAWDSFFHLDHDDQRRMFPIFRNHAAPGAALMFTSGPSHGEAIGELFGEPLYHASLSGGEYRALLAENGFEVVAQVDEDPSCGRHTIWLARRK